MKKGFIFPGQGSQSVGMGQDLPNRDILKKANEILGYDLMNICFEGPAETLTMTQNAQPSILTISYMMFLLQEGQPDMVAGHSLGEYTALCAAGVLAFEDAVRLVHLRGKLMEEAMPKGSGTMAAVLGMEERELNQVCSSIAGTVQIANYNAPGQLVISGETPAVNECCSVIIEKYGKKAIPLQVSGPFHSSLMKPAAEKFAAHLEKVTFHQPKCPVIMNVTADFLQTPEQARELLVRQLYSSVLWQQSVEKMVREQVEVFEEIGPGKVLTGLVKKITRELGK